MYGSVAGVQALVPALTIGSDSTPDSTEVTAWLNEGTAVIDRHIGTAGYTTPVLQATAPLAYDEVTALANLYAAAYALRSRSIDGATGEGEERSEVWLKDFWARLRDLAGSNLSLLGLVAIVSATTSRRRRIRTLQGRRVDGYARGATDEWEVVQGEYTRPNVPSE